MSLREQGKQERRRIILRTAEELIRRGGDVSFSMRTLARKAEFAFVTPFNLFGSKSGVLAALLAARLDAERDRLTPISEGTDPIARVLGLARHASESYTADPELFRPLLRGLGNALEGPDQAALARQTLELWELALRDAIDQGLVTAERSPKLLARSFHLTFRGAISAWIHEEIGDAELAQQTEYGVALGLLGATTGAVRKLLLDRLLRIESGPAAAVGDAG